MKTILLQQAVARSNCNVISTSCTDETFLLHVLDCYQSTPSSRPMAHERKLSQLFVYSPTMPAPKQAVNKKDNGTRRSRFMEYGFCCENQLLDILQSIW
jgi:hypothetical protein